MTVGTEMACEVKLTSIFGTARSRVNEVTVSSLVASTNSTRCLVLMTSTSSSRSWYPLCSSAFAQRPCASSLSTNAQPKPSSCRPTLPMP